MNQRGAAVLDRPDAANFVDKRLKSVVKNEGARKHDRHNLLIKIDVGSSEAEFHCQREEHAGSHKNRHVRFLANADCKVHFETALFNPKILELSQGKAKDVEIQDGAVGSTSYFVSISASTAAQPMMQRLALVIGDPKIVVP